MAKLYIFTKQGRSEFNLVDHNVIGRHPKNRIKILEAGISKVHCSDCVRRKPDLFHPRPGKPQRVLCQRDAA